MRVTALVAAMLLLTVNARATDFTVPLLNEDGKPYEKCLKMDPAQPGQCVDKQQITLGRFLFDALNVSEPGLTNEGIVSRGLLALKVRDAKDLDLTDVQRDVAKAALFNSTKSGNFPVAIVQALKVIDPAALGGK